MGDVAATDQRSQRYPWWQYALVGLVVLVGGYFFVARVTSRGFDQGFDDFQPEVTDFPPAPVPDAHTVLGYGGPVGWPTDPYDCPYDGGSGSNYGWHTLRHDWVDDGEAKAWVISEMTVGLDDAAEYLQGYRDRVRYCGWMYDSLSVLDDGPAFNAIETELDGLPDDALAFRVDAAPELRATRGFRFSNPDDFHALGVIIPGAKRGEVMNVMWVGWGTDVPPDEFVAAVNKLYGAARNAPEKDYSGGESIDFTFHEFDAERAGIESIVGSDVRGNYDEVYAPSCGLGLPDTWDWNRTEGVDADGFDIGTGTVNFTVGVGRWRSSSEYLRAKDQTASRLVPLCIDGHQTPWLTVEPIEIAGLPEGTVVSRWNEDGDKRGRTLVAMLTDDDKHVIMFVAWQSTFGPIPEDKFVDVVNRSWDQFQADNP